VAHEGWPPAVVDALPADVDHVDLAAEPSDR